MRTKIILSSLLAGGLLAGVLTACATDKEDGHESKAKAARLEAQAKVGKAEAEKIALAKVPNGMVKEAEIEKEAGKLVWSFDLTTPDTKDITEVLVDARTGAIVSVETETPEDQAREKAKEDGEKEEKD